MRHRRSVLTLTALIVLSLAGCGGSHPSTTAVSTTTSTATSTPAPTPAANPGTQTGTGQAATAPSPPAGGPVPAGFDPVAFTAISPARFWLLGTAPCSHPVCTSIVRTTDAGAHFVGIPAPAVRLQSPSTDHGLSVLLFADALDGFAGSAGYPEPSPLYVTHDGGAHWARRRSDVIAFTVTAGHIYALTGHCANGVCSQLHLARSPAGTDDWSSVALPVGSASGIPSLAAAGTSAWVSLTPSAGTPSHQVLLISRDGGRTFATGTSLCVAGLTGHLTASSPAVVWAVCPSGMMAEGWRSADAGARWTPVPRHPLPGMGGGLANSLQLAPASDTTVLLLPGASEPAFLSSDSGATFRHVQMPSAQGGVSFAGFTDPQTGSALVLDNAGGLVGPDRAPVQTLWRSTDGGVHWHEVHIAAGA